MKILFNFLGGAILAGTLVSVIVSLARPSKASRA